MSIMSKAALLKLTAAAAVIAMLSGCSDERGFRPKAFPKVFDVQARTIPHSGNDDVAAPEAARIADVNPAATTETELQQVSEYIDDYSLWFKEFTAVGANNSGKLKEFNPESLTAAKDAGVLIKGLSINRREQNSIEVYALLNYAGTKKRLVAAGVLNFQTEELITLGTTFSGEETAAAGVEAYALVCQKAMCQGLIKIFLKVTPSSGAPILAIFDERADSKRTKSSINADFHTFEEAEGIRAESGEPAPPARGQLAPPPPAAGAAVAAPAQPNAAQSFGLPAKFDHAAGTQKVLRLLNPSSGAAATTQVAQPGVLQQVVNAQNQKNIEQEKADAPEGTEVISALNGRPITDPQFSLLQRFHDFLVGHSEKPAGAESPEAH